MRKVNKKALKMMQQFRTTVKAPKLQLYDVVYNQYGEEFIVIDIQVSYGVHFKAPQCLYLVTSAIFVKHDGSLSYETQDGFYEKELDETWFESSRNITSTYDDDAVLEAITAKFNELYA